MSNSKLNDTYKESTKENFVVMHNNGEFSKEDNAEICQSKNYAKRKNSREIVEYTDDVADQVRSLYEKIAINLEEYFQGKNKVNDVNNRIKQFYKSIKKYCITTGIIDENNEIYKSKILKDIYRSYRYNAVIAAVNVNDSEGRKIALEFTQQNADTEEYFVYYNSEYYHSCEGLREALTEMVNTIAVEENIKDFDTQSIDKRKRYVYDYGFNYAWSWNNKTNIESGVHINKNIVPPENFKVFYKECLDNQGNGKLLINYEDNNIEVDLQANYKCKNENCNLQNILKSKNIIMTTNTKVDDFLNSFYILTKELDK